MVVERNPPKVIRLKYRQTSQREPNNEEDYVKPSSQDEVRQETRDVGGDQGDPIRGQASDCGSTHSTDSKITVLWNPVNSAPKPSMNEPRLTTRNDLNVRNSKLQDAVVHPGSYEALDTLQNQEKDPEHNEETPYTSPNQKKGAEHKEGPATSQNHRERSQVASSRETESPLILAVEVVMIIIMVIFLIFLISSQESRIIASLNNSESTIRSLSYDLDHAHDGLLNVLQDNWSTIGVPMLLREQRNKIFSFGFGEQSPVRQDIVNFTEQNSLTETKWEELLQTALDVDHTFREESLERARLMNVVQHQTVLSQVRQYLFSQAPVYDHLQNYIDRLLPQAAQLQSAARDLYNGFSYLKSLARMIEIESCRQRQRGLAEKWELVGTYNVVQRLAIIGRNLLEPQDLAILTADVLISEQVHEWSHNVTAELAGMERNFDAALYMSQRVLLSLQHKHEVLDFVSEMREAGQLSSLSR
ncbi:MAG: hypothetical protein Q9220_007615 [cf. Caloplaca sp. 1 TL-2023]